MTTLEVLLGAERTLMDEDEPYEHNKWQVCTCGHIYHAVNGHYSAMAGAGYDMDYQQVLGDVVQALGIKNKVNGMDSLSHVLSDYVEIVALGRKTTTYDDYPKVKREHALKVIREAITAIRKQDDEAVLKVIDSHTYGIST